MKNPTFVRRLVLKNYRSVESCGLQLGPLVFLVGPNGAGKSNVIDALRLITDSLRSSLDHALRERGGIHEVRRRSGGHPTHFGIRVDFTLPDGGQEGHFSFEVGAVKQKGFEVKTEECVVGKSRYLVRSGSVRTMTGKVSPPASRDRLYLVTAAGLPEFRPVFDALSRMGFYNLNPDQIRSLQSPDQGEILARDGRNLPSVLQNLSRSANGVSEAKQRIERYLSRVVPGVEGVDPKRLDHMETIEFRQRVVGQKEPWRFSAITMSDGTLRALGTLVALFQPFAPLPVPLVGIEEPEIALHPAAAGVLLDALREASQSRQVLVTSHSPDLLDDPELQGSELLAVVARDGLTEVGPIDQAGKDALRNHLYTAGELLRLNQLQPAEALFDREEAVQMRLFDQCST